METKLFRQAKAKVALIMTVLMISCLLPVNALTAYADDYTVITTAAQLDTVVRNNLSGKFRLGNDIDLSSYSYNSSTWTSSYGWKGIGTSLLCGFKGTFDGDGYTIKGLWSSGRGSNQGLFGWLNGATITNLNIELSSKGITGSGERKGALAGDAYYGTKIDNVNVIGNGATITGSANYIAGLVGVVDSSVVKNSSVIDVNVTGYSYTGGLAGAIMSSTSSKSSVSKCYVMGITTTGTGSYSGGFAGAVYNLSNLTSCYVFDANVKATFYTGGFVGTVYGCSTIQKSCSYGKAATTVGYIAGGFAGEATNATISNCYAQVDVTSKTSGAGGFIAYSAGCTSVFNTYCAGKVTAGSSTNVGAYVGHATISFSGTNYYDSSLCSLSGYGSSGTKSGSSSAYPQGKNTATMMKQATFTGWDFNTIWRIDENLTYPYFWDWGWWNKESTITFDANGGTGTMAQQVVENGVATTLDSCTFTRADYKFLGWTTVAGGDDVEYANGATITVSEDTTLYAVWGTPDYSWSSQVIKNDYLYTGDTVHVIASLGVSNTKNSVGMTNATVTVYLNQHVDLSAVYVILNGAVVTPNYIYNTSSHTVTFYLGDVNPGDSFIVLANSTVKASGEGQNLSFTTGFSGDVAPY